MPATSPAHALLPTARLRLQPPDSSVMYHACTTWESFVNDEYQRSTIGKQVALHVQPNGQGFAVDFRTSPPVLTKPEDAQALEEVAVRLAELYQWVVVQATPEGEMVALLNHSGLLQTWQQMAQSMQAATPEEDQVTKALLGFLDRQLQNPANFLQSLRHDYLYQTLMPDWYNQQLAHPDGPGRTRQFSNFFANTSLWFNEQAEVLPSEQPEQLTLRLHGTLDAQKTNLEVIQGLVAEALQGGGPAAGGADGLVLHFKYEAAYVLELRTGLPIGVDLNVHVRAGQLYNKEYTLTIARQ